MDIPRIGSVDSCSRGRPIPSAEYVGKWMPLRQSRLPGLVTHKASEFAAVGKTPVLKIVYIVTIHSGNVIEGFLPYKREISHISVSCPDELRHPIENNVGKDLEAWGRPRQAASEVSVLSAPGAVDHAAPRIVASNLPCLEVSAYGFTRQKYLHYA